MLLSEAWENYQSDKMLEGYSLQTLKAYTVQYNLLVKHFPQEVKLEEIEHRDLKAYLVKDSERLKPASLGHRIRFVKSLFKWANDEGFIKNNPARKLKEPKTSIRIPKFLTEKEIEYLREACCNSFENALFEFMYSTGCRIGEIVLLDKESISLESRSAIVRGKGDKEREVYFNIRCEIWLKRYLEERLDTNRALFVTERTPRRLSIAQMRYVIKRISSRAGINKSIHPHQLRHSYATHMLNNGAPLEVIQNLLGHEKSETTKIYAQLSGAMRRELYRKYF
ncbi:MULTISPECIES: tyrosine-type recombinase/integrase [Bacillaceae]|uniref:Tyrosine-type recombinase/integrase n=1 Tax=Evansella alkalicola TaxID=745819 RepID=A0ABS6JYQ7_9BACI|nr:MULTISPECIES: tyrosine-type recombinase/integrase [Bacillaceae]MBU9723726.1 tyrosine-type recombinase/integrase [Bacillus alkalicola]